MLPWEEFRSITISTTISLSMAKKSIMIPNKSQKNQKEDYYLPCLSAIMISNTSGINFWLYQVYCLRGLPRTDENLHRDITNDYLLYINEELISVFTRATYNIVYLLCNIVSNIWKQCINVSTVVLYSSIYYVYSSISSI